jgi:signal transduction histidine kinase
MQVTDLLTWITQGSLLLITVLTFLDFFRHRDRSRLDIALMFGALGALVLLQGITRGTGVDSRWLRTAGALLFLAHPVLLLRLVQHFRPVPQTVRRLALGGMLASWGILIALDAPYPVPLTLLIVAYFAYVEGYAALAFMRGGLRTGGVTSWRLLLAAAGSGLLALVILLAGVNAAVPAGTGITTPISQLLALLAMLSYYAGFVPPRWLHQTWQLSELQRFLREMAGRSAAERATTTLDHLCRAGTRAVGGLAAVVVLWDETEQQLRIRASSNPRALSGALTGSDGVVQRAWRERQPLLARTPADFGPADAALAASVGAGALIVVPLVTVERAWGLLIVCHRRAPLFVEDDIQLLALFAEQSASTLAYAALLSEQQHLVAQLQQRSAQLEAANKELESFSYSVSHDLRAPLRSIDGFSQALLEDYGETLDAPGRHYLQRVRAATQRMAQLIDDLLSLARVTRSELHREAVDLSMLARSITAELQQREPQRQVECAIVEGVVAQGDRRLLQVVLENLLGNAWKFTGVHPCAHIEFGALTHEGQVAYYVRDDGAGFDMTYAGKLFGAFQRLHAMTEFSGNGIGLATVQRVIHRHGGRIWAEGAVEQGATFYFTL